ncbi:molybdopterin synthase sulfur carrier subunit, partial [Aeromonas taiwanensis]|uniref:molybdopterin synthase sulfur carrier subunit n=1 Tax=Aeromonas taiwanensis TaxID=633417 RepID=UPI00248E548C
MIKVLFFAQVRELVDCDELSLPCEHATAEALRSALSERGDKWALALEAGKLLVAVNQTLVRSINTAIVGVLPVGAILF